MTATSKLAQVARGSRTCTRCGRNRTLKEFGVHPRWGSPYSVCVECRHDAQVAGIKKHHRKKAKQRTAAATEAATAIDKIPVATTNLDALSRLRVCAHHARGMSMIHPGMSAHADDLERVLRDLEA